MINYSIKKVKDMSIEELIGQVIMIGLPYTYLDDGYKKFIAEYKIGNYILFARNYVDSKQMKIFMRDLYQYTELVTGSYPLVSIDQEGGMVVRLFKDVTFPASPLTTSATTTRCAPYLTGKIIANDMLKHGINLNLAPCLEINQDLLNPLVNVRGYGATKEIVLENASKFVLGLKDGGVLPCIKHFPGAGSSTKDSHLELPIINDSKEQLLSYNMYPFANLIDSDCLMTSHCIYQSFDEIPSTLSKILLTDVLRKKMGFNGLIISDGMEMNAIKDYYGLGKGCIMALNAGCDLLLLCHEYEQQKIAFDAVKKAVIDGVIKRETLEEKVERINKKKEFLKLSLSAYFTQEQYQQVKEEHQIMEEIVDNSYTLIMGKAPYLTDKTLILCANAKVGSIVEDELDGCNLANELRDKFKNHTIIKFTKDESFKDDILKIIDDFDNIIIYSYDAYNDIVQKDTINALLNTSKDVITSKDVFVVSIKGPSDRAYFNNLKNYACLYEYTPNSIKTIIKQLKKEIKLNGKLPL